MGAGSQSSIEQFDFTAPGRSADWQPGAILRLPFPNGCAQRRRR